MKKVFILFLALFALQLQAQKFEFPQGIVLRIELDSITENAAFVRSFKITNKKDTLLTQLRVTAKVNGNFNTNQDSSEFNFNMTFEGVLDSAKGIKRFEKDLFEQKQAQIRREEAKLLKLYEKNKDVSPLLREKNAQPKQQQNIVPKSYGSTSLAKPNPTHTLLIQSKKDDYPPQKRN